MICIIIEKTNHYYGMLFSIMTSYCYGQCGVISVITRQSNVVLTQPIVHSFQTSVASLPIPGHSKIAIQSSVYLSLHFKQFYSLLLLVILIKINRLEKWIYIDLWKFNFIILSWNILNDSIYNFEIMNREKLKKK